MEGLSGWGVILAAAPWLGSGPASGTRVQSLTSLPSALLAVDEHTRTPSLCPSWGPGPSSTSLSLLTEFHVHPCSSPAPFAPFLAHRDVTGRSDPWILPSSLGPLFPLGHFPTGFLQEGPWRGQLALPMPSTLTGCPWQHTEAQALLTPQSCTSHFLWSCSPPTWIQLQKVCRSTQSQQQQRSLCSSRSPATAITYSLRHPALLWVLPQAQCWSKGTAGSSSAQDFILNTWKQNLARKKSCSWPRSQHGHLELSSTSYRQGEHTQPSKQHGIMEFHSTLLLGSAWECCRPSGNSL